jgi:alpha-L-fucosidase
MVDAFREEGLKVGFYHSLIDWHHPEFPVDGLHPQRDDESFKQQASERDIRKYKQYLHGQVEELLTQYGKIDYLWFDFSYPDRFWGGKGKDDWGSEELEQLVFKLQPDIILNDRLDLGRGVVTPEQYQPQGRVQIDGQPVVWEACQTLNCCWGYDRDNMDWKSADVLFKMLIDSVSKGGNLLLNVGPNGRGEIEEKALSTLREIGRWMRVNNRSIYGATSSGYKAPADCRYTQKGNRLYLHIFSWPFKHIHVEGLAGKVKYAQFLHDASEIAFHSYTDHQEHAHTTPKVGEGLLTFELPVQKPDVCVPVIEIFLDERYV